MREDPSVGSIAGFEEWLGHNELGLALDELEGIGELNGASPAFWAEMAVAAVAMELHEHAARYRGRMRA